MTDGGGDRFSPLHTCLRQHALRTPSKVAIVWYGRRITYRELDDLSERFAERLTALSVGPGDVVLLFMSNCPQFLIAHLGAQKAGAAVSPCNPMAKAYEFGHQARELCATVIVAEDRLLSVVAEAASPQHRPAVFSVNAGSMLPAVIDIDVPTELSLPGDPALSRLAWVRDFDAELRDSATSVQFCANVDPQALALIAYTSGTTGLPKGAMVSHKGVVHRTAATAETFGLTAADVMLSDTPLHHISGLVTGLSLPIYTGATLVLLHSFDPAAVLQAIECCRVTWWYTMAPSLPWVMSADDASHYAIESLRTVVATSFGLTLTEALGARWQAFAPGCTVYEAGYGMSETHTCDTLMPRDAIRWGTNGRPVRGVEVRIVDPVEGRLLPSGQPGEILLRSEVPFLGYWRRPEATSEVFADGWLRTGDIGMLDAEGYLTFIGRRKEMIKVWSYSVYPEEVEAILATHPDVQQAAVVGCADPNRGEALRAYVVLRRGATAIGGSHVDTARAQANLLDWCTRHMAHYKVPRQVEFRRRLPATGSGKLLRRLLGPDATARLVH